jgi:hypothetical protein
MDSSTWFACACQNSGAANEVAVRNADELTSPGRRDGDHLICQWRAPNEVGAAMRLAPHAIASSCQYLNARSYWYRPAPYRASPPRNCLGSSVATAGDRAPGCTHAGSGEPHAVMRGSCRAGHGRRLPMVPAGAVVSRGNRAFLQSWLRTLRRLPVVESE